MAGILKSAMTSPGLYGPQTLGLFTPQNNEGLGLPGGQVSFNLPRTAPAPGTQVNFPQNVPMGGFNFSVTRTASSDPVKNIIADIQNPLNSTTIDMSPAKSAPPPPLASAASNFPRYDMDWLAWPGQTAGYRFTPSLGRPGFTAVDQMGAANALKQNYYSSPQFGLRGRMLAGAAQSLFPYPFL